MSALLMVLVLLAPTQAVTSQAGGTSLPPFARVQSEVNLFIELHNHLQAESRAAEDSLPEYSAEVKAYREARELAKDPAVWQVVNDACIAGPDIAGIGKVTGHLPAALAAADQEAVRKMIGALESAWPRFQAGEAVERNRSLQRAWSKVLHVWGMVEERLLTTLYEKFAFQPIDAKITVYPVIDANELGASGKTAKGYYLIVPVGRLPNLVIIEEILHEVTHVLDDHQPPGSSTFLMKLRQQGAGVDKQALDVFTHGLIEWNAGELIRKSVRADYKPLLNTSPDLRAPIEGYVPTYQGPWVAYLEGKIPADDAIKGMISALKPASAPAQARSGS